MKLELNKDQLGWLDLVINRFIMISRRIPEYSDAARTARKMRYKFSGNPTQVNLTGKERSLVRELAGYRAQELEKNPTTELVVIRQILEGVPQ